MSIHHRSDPAQIVLLLLFSFVTRLVFPKVGTHGSTNINKISYCQVIILMPNLKRAVKNRAYISFHQFEFLSVR